HRALDEEQVVLDVAPHDLETLLGHALGAQMTGHTHALEHLRRPCALTDRTRLAHVMRAVSLGTAPEVVTTHGALKALALADPGDRDGLAVLEGLHGDGVADLEVAGLAELHQMTQAVLEAGLLEMAELRLAEVLVLAVLEAE